MKEGESAQYNSSGHKIVLYHDRCEINTPQFVVNAESEAVINAPLIELNGNVIGTESAVFAKEVKDMGGGYSMSGMRSTYNGHTHHENDEQSETNSPTQTM